MRRNELLIGCRLVLLLAAGSSPACGAEEPNSASRAHTGAAGASAGSVLAGEIDSPKEPVQPPPASVVAKSNDHLDGCAPGVYSGEYDIGFLGAGPITFTLVPSQPASSSSVPCQEFCPELVVSSDGGQFKASLADIFEGSAKLTGGLDCRSGEFRVEMVDGAFSFGAPDDPMDLQLGELTGEFTGHFDAGAPASIKGDIKCNAGIDVEGTFSVQLSP